MKVADLCRTHGISDVTLYNWRGKYGGMEVSEAKRLKVLETENRQLEQLLADALLENKSIKDVLANSGNACCSAKPALYIEEWADAMPLVFQWFSTKSLFC